MQILGRSEGICYNISDSMHLYRIACLTPEATARRTASLGSLQLLMEHSSVLLDQRQRQLTEQDMTHFVTEESFLHSSPQANLDNPGHGLERCTELRRVGKDLCECIRVSETVSVSTLETHAPD